MSEELKNVCENCNFDNNFQEVLEGIEKNYNLIANDEKEDTEKPLNKKQLTLVEWILENTKIDEFNCLSEKERFLYGLGFLSSELINY
ncbi:hypothetical protein [Clostridium botulinum]|uniref:hypothetical protein n=1 Tax=Clostridium botulinum TaxID=1491 RepID=UPI00249EEEC6|nr:hypothetical protein [Clostridium botulinum]MDU4596469.1 hypothetical protein [Clostridium sporogenes]WGZ48103.1 hypothetical protein HEQ52_18325 [Clostridium botulinum]